MFDIQKALTELAACRGSWDFADLLRRLRVEGGPTLLRQVAGVGRAGEGVLSHEVLAGWPEEEMNCYAEFVSSLPYRPDPRNMPCGRRELFVAEALADRTLSKAKRVALWRAFAMSGFRFPRYSGGNWSVPLELMDHTAVRGWLCATHAEGWTDLRNSDAYCFAGEKPPSFKSAFEKSAWDAIGKDSPAGLMMPLAMMGKALPLAYLREALRARAERILVYLLTDPDKAFKVMKPREMLFYVCANWNDDAAIPTVALLEKLAPGLVASSVDAYGHDALWYTLYQRDARGVATPAARRKIDPLDANLIELGCDPARACFLGLSWQDVAERREDVDGV